MYVFCNPADSVTLILIREGYGCNTSTTKVAFGGHHQGGFLPIEAHQLLFLLAVHTYVAFTLLTSHQRRWGVRSSVASVDFPDGSLARLSPEFRHCRSSPESSSSYNNSLSNSHTIALLVVPRYSEDDGWLSPFSSWFESLSFWPRTDNTNGKSS